MRLKNYITTEHTKYGLSPHSISRLCRVADFDRVCPFINTHCAFFEHFDAADSDKAPSPAPPGAVARASTWLEREPRVANADSFVERPKQDPGRIPGGCLGAQNKLWSLGPALYWNWKKRVGHESEVSLKMLLSDWLVLNTAYHRTLLF